MHQNNSPFNKNIFLYILVALLFLLALFFIPKIPKENIVSSNIYSEEAVNVYTSRKEPLIKDIFSAFERKYKVRINFITDDANKLIMRAASEGSSSPMDVFIAADVNNLILAESKGLLAKLESPVVDKLVSAELRSDYWTALTKRARVIIYNKVNSELSNIKSYMDLADPLYKGKVLISSSNSPYNQSLLAFIIDKEGEIAARNWVKGLVNNFARKPQGGDVDQIRALIAGEGQIAVVNSYYLGRQILMDPTILDKIEVVKPSEETMINISGAGIGKYSKNPEKALALIEFMLTSEMQIVYSNKNQEYPVVKGIEISPVLKKWPLTEDNTDIKQAWQHLNLAVKIADQEGWR